MSYWTTRNFIKWKSWNFFKINDYKDLSKKIIYVYKNRYKLKDKVKIGYDNLYRWTKKKI